jgi:metal-sulfur cluster biosynthetic enzyme
MGGVLKRDIEGKVARIPDVTQCSIEVVLDPPWNQGLMSVGAQLQLGLM